MSRGAIWRAFMEEQKRRREDEAGFAPPAYKSTAVRAATQQADTGYIPILKQLEEMLAQKQYRSPFEQAPQALQYPEHTVRPGETLSGIAQQHLKSGARWPEIRDLNIPVLQEGLSRFAPGDPRLQRELGHWIFPGQVFKIPKEPSALPPPGFQQELQKLLQEKRIQDRIQPFPRPDIGVKEPIPQPPPVKEPSIVEPEFPDLHPRQRGLSLKQPIEWATIDPEKQKQFDEKVSKVSKGTLSVLETIGLSLSSGGAHLTESLLNIPRVVYGLAMHLWDLITPDSFYKIENDPILGAYNKRMDDLSKYIAKTIDKPLQEKDMSVAEEFLSIGFAAVPQVVAAAMVAYGMGPLAAIDKATIPASASTTLGTFAKTYPNVARMLPFGVIAASGAQMEAEQEGATFLQAVGSGVLSGMGEMATESLPFDQFMKIVNKMGIKPLVEQGSKNLFKHYGAVGLDYLKGVVMEVAQEAVMEPWSQLAKKITYDKTMPLTGEGGVFDMDAMIQGGYGGLAMTVVLGALGLPATARSHHMIRRAMQEQQRVNLFELAAEMNRELNNYNQILGWKPDQPVGIEHSGVEHLDNFSFDVFDISGERGYVRLKNNRGDIVSIQLGDIKHIDGNKIILHQDVIPVIQQGLGSVFDLNSEDGVRNALEQILSGFTDYDDAFTALEWIDRNDSVFYTAFGTEVNPVLFRQALDLSRQYPELSPLEEPPKKAPVETRKRPPEVVPTEKPQAGKLPKEAYDLVVRTKNSLKKKYGRDLITWIEGGEKPPIPDGLGKNEAKDMETKLIKIAERVGMAPTEEAPPKEPWQMTKDELVKNMEVYGEGVGAWERNKPWTGELPPVGTWRMDPNTGALEQLRLMDVNEITPMEPEDEVRGRDDYKQYVEWAKQGIQPPPITVVRGIEDGNWLSINRRRLMAAKESGQKTILAWVSDTDMETAMPTPTHKSVVEQALKEGKPVPPEVLKDYPELRAEGKPAETTGEMPRIFYVKVGTQNVEVIKNPTNSEYQQLSKEFRKEYPRAPKDEIQIRTTYDEKGNKYIWRADKATHDAIEKHLQTVYGVKASQNAPVIESETESTEVEPETKPAAKEPWEMTREEFISDVPKGFKYIADLGETIARYNPDGTITLTDAFFGHNEQARKELLAHEKAHGIVKDVYANNENFWDLVNSGLFGKYDSDAMKFKGVPYAFKNVDEILTQLVTDLQVGVPKKFRDKYAVQYNIAQQILDGKEVDIRQAIQQALAEGKPVPPEVLADYPDLIPKEAAPAKTEKPPAEKKEAPPEKPAAPVEIAQHEAKPPPREAVTTGVPAPKTEEASPWKVTTNIINGKRVYGVYRIIDTNEPNHSGNREVIGYYDTREEAERIAKEGPPIAPATPVGVPEAEQEERLKKPEAAPETKAKPTKEPARAKLEVSPALLEPQVKDAVLQFNKWGINTYSSAGYQYDPIKPGLPKGYTAISYEEGKIPKVARDAVTKQFPDVKFTESRISFTYDFKGDETALRSPENVDHVKAKWQKILDILKPYMEKPAAPAETAPKSEVITERDLHALTWDTIERPYKETQGVGKYNGLAWRKRKYHAVDEQGIEHEYTVRIRNDGEIEVTKGEKTGEQRRKEYAQAYEQFPQQLRRAIDKEWPNLVDAQKIIIAQMATGQKYDKVSAKVVLEGAARNKLLELFPEVKTLADAERALKSWWDNLRSMEVKPVEETGSTKEARVGTPEAKPELPIPVSPDDVPYELAYNAFRGISMSPEKRARQVQQDYVDYMERVYGELKPLAKTPEQQEILRAELERYKEGYLKHLEAYLRAKSRTMSSMIVGASNFPVERNRKALEAEQKRIEEMFEWGKRARNAIKRKLQGTKTTEQKADATFNKLKREADNAMEVLVSVDQGKSHYDKSAFRNSLAGYIRRAVDRGEFEAARRALDYIKDKQSKLLDSKALKYPVFANNHSIWNYPDKVEAERGPAKTGVEVMAEYKGVRIENHYDDERTRIIFDDKPSEEVRKNLKGHGFRWSPTNNAWQRKLTDNAVRHAKGILDKHFEPVVPMEGKPGESVPVEGPQQQAEKSSIAKAQQARIDKVLNKRTDYGEHGVHTRKEFLDEWIPKGAKVVAKQIKDVNAMEEAKERIAWLRLHAPLGNPNHSRTIEYNELKEQVEKGIFKTEYRLYMPDSSFFTITKIEYDYGKSIELPKAVKPNYLVEEKDGERWLIPENQDEIKNVIDHAIKTGDISVLKYIPLPYYYAIYPSPIGKKLSLNPFPGHSYRGASYSEYKYFLKSSKTGDFWTGDPTSAFIGETPERVLLVGKEYESYDKINNPEDNGIRTKDEVYAVLQSVSGKDYPEGFLGWKVIWQNPDFDLKDIGFPFSKMPDDVVKEVVGDAAKQEAEKLPKEEKGAEPGKPETVEKEPELKQERLKERTMEVIYRGSNVWPTGPQWEVQVTEFKDVETGKVYEWWSDRALSDFKPPLKLGDKVVLSATTRPYSKNNVRLTHVKIRLASDKKLYDLFPDTARVSSYQTKDEAAEEYAIRRYLLEANAYGEAFNEQLRKEMEQIIKDFGEDVPKKAKELDSKVNLKKNYAAVYFRLLAAYENAPPRLIKELEAETKKAGYAPGFDGILDTIWYYKDLGLKEGFFGTSVYDILNRKNSLDRKGEPLRIALRSFFNIFESRKDLDDFVKEVVEEEIVNPIKKQAESLSLEEKGKVKKPAEVKAEAGQATPPTTPEILEWDAVTEEHFKNWLEAYIPEEDIATVEAGIREYVKDDPDILKTASWNRIRDLAEAEGYMIATREEAERIAKGEPEKPAETEKKEAKKELKPFKPLSKGNTVTAYTEKNDPIEVKYVLAEAGDLVTSHDTSLNVNPDYPEELQPRQRERAASEVQVHSIASRLNPARLGENPMITDGAPIIGPDGVVETGNGRTIAIKRVYKQNTEKAQEYRNWLIENADKFGLDRNTVEKAKEPVLVRVRLTEVDRVVFTQEGNVSTVAEMSASEIAIQDAKKLTPKVLSLFVPNEEGRIDSAANRSFISAFIGEVVPGSERGKLMDAKGRTLTQDGIRRIRNAIFARVYGNPLALEKLSEDTDVNVRNQINSMVNAAPKFLEIKEGIEKGDYFPLDITEDIAAAMVKLSDLRDTGMTVEGYLRQLSLFGEELTDIGKAVLNIFDKHKRSAKRITAILQEYAHGVELAGSPKQIQLYQTNPPTKDDVLAVAVKKVESLHEGQFTIFETQEVVHERTRTPGEEGTRAKTEREGEEPPEGEAGPAGETAREKLAEKEKELDKQADKHKRDMPMGQSIRLAMDTHSKGTYAFADKDIENRYQAAHGIPTPGFWEKAKGIIEEAGHIITRSHRHLPNTGYYMPLRSELINLAKYRTVAAGKAVERLKGILADLKDHNDFNLLERKVVLDDLQESYQIYLDMLEENNLTEKEMPFMWPFGFDKAKFDAEYKNLDAEISKNPDVQKVINDRADFWDKFVAAYVEAQQAIGFKVEGKFKRTSYYRHQVLEYAELKNVMGTGKRLKTPRGRSWLRDRAKEGSVLDYNTNYLEAEFEVISQMYYDMRIAKAIEYIDRRYNIIDRLKAEAVNINDERIMPFFEQLASTLTKGAGNEPVTAEELYRAILNKKMAIGFDRLGELASQGVLPDDKGKYADLIAVLGNTYTYNRGKPPEEQARLDDQSTRQLFAYCNWLLKSKDQKTIPGKGAAATIFKGLHEKKKHIKETLGKDYVTWEDLIPEGFSTYQPTKGNMFFFAESLPATIAERLIEGQLQEYSIKKEDLRRVLAKGSKFPEMVVDEKIAMTLEDLTVGSANTSLVGDFFKDILTTWKVYQLISPPRYLKYNLRNLTSDIEYPFALNRGTFKFVPEATKALFDYLFRGASPSGMLRQWIERGGIEATLQSQEMGAINHLKDFERIVNKYKTLKDAPAEVWNSWWKNARLSTDMRESIMRYASFVSYVEQMKGNIDKAHVDKNGNIAKGHLHEGRPKNFGASNPEEIMALDNLFDRAYWLSNELLGAYDRVSVAGKWLRKYLMPFWSWNEVNMKRFIQIMRNCANDDLIAEQVGRFFINKRRKQIGVAPVRNNSRIWKSKLTRGIAMSPLIAINIGKTTLSLMLLWLLASIWNKIMFPDAQYTIPEHDRKGFHLVVGRNEDGSLIYYNRLGSITDLFEWIGDVPWNYVNDVMKGRKTVMDVAKKIMAAPFLNIYGEVGPHFQITTELITGKSTFPDPTDPGDIRDRVYHIMQGLGLAAVYNRIAGRPTRTWGDEVQRLLAYKQEQGQGAYYDIRDEVREFLKSEGVPQGRWSGERSPKAEALFYLRLAIRYEDARAMEKYAIQYVNNGGNSKDLETSLKNMHPLYGLSKERKRKFYNEWLDDEGRERLRWAEKFYYETLLGNPEGKIGYYPKETMSQISSIVREHKR